MEDNLNFLEELTFAGGAGRPKFRMLASAFAQAIAAQRLPTGTRLPSERSLTQRTGLSRITVSAAYRELQSQGLIRSFVGNGTFVCATQETGQVFSWMGKISDSAHRMAEPISDELMQTKSPAISFSVGSPALSCFPLRDYVQAITQAMQRDALRAVGIGPTVGLDPLRESIASRVGTQANRVMVLTGAQQGLDLISRCLINSGDAVIVDEPCYPGAIQAFGAAGANMVGWGVPGWDPDELEGLILKHKPKLIYTNPTFQNPTGANMPMEQRLAVLALAGRYRIPIVEDDIHRELFLNTAPPPSLSSLDEHNVVIHINTFSKCFAPGIRIGWLLAAPYVIKQLTLIKMRDCLFSEGLGQLALRCLLQNGKFDQHLQGLRQEHHKRMLCMAEALEKYVAADLLQWRRPSGGLYFWCRLAPGISSRDLQECAQDKGVQICTGEGFYTRGQVDDHVRLCFSSPERDEIPTGIRRLGRAIDRLNSGAVCSQNP
jgi:DNA-binding transcriptional MocR family regulator